MHLAHARHLRRGRHSESGRIYLVTTCTDQRRQLFADLPSGRAVIASLRAESVRAKTLCFVLMPDHLHWLIQLAEGADLSSVVRNAKAGSARRLRLQRPLKHRVWQPGFHDRALRRDDDVVDVARYVVGNPLRAGLVRQLGDYPFWDAIWL